MFAPPHVAVPAGGEKTPGADGRRALERVGIMKVMTIIAGILMAVVGIFCLFTPGLSFLNVSWLIGLMLVVSGVSLVVDYIVLRKTRLVGALDLLMGMLSGVLGVVLLVNQPLQVVTEMVAVYLLGVWMLVSGVIRIVEAVAARRMPGSAWGWTLVLGCLMVALGIYSFFHPVAAMFAIGWLIGFYILLAGVDLVSFGIALHKVVDAEGEKHWTTMP